MDDRVLAEAARLRREALGRQAEGRYEEAYTLLRRRADLTPGDAFAWADIGGCLYAARKSQHALLAWDEALRLEPGHADLLCGKAGVLHSLDRDAEAKALYAQALAVQPESFGAGFGLVMLAIDAGDWDEAAKHAAPLEARHKGHLGLLWTGAKIAVGRGDLETARDRAAELVADPRLSADQRNDALQLQAEIRDRLELKARRKGLGLR
jgi:tetratricopeptide (TPR) repeat protein